MNTRITVSIADDHPIFRKGLREVIEAEPGLTLVAEAEDGESALEKIQSLLPQVAVLDVDMPRKDGLEVARAVKQLRLPVGVILLTMHREERFFNAALDLGVQGYVLKDGAVSEIVNAIRSVAAGQRYITPLLTDYLLNRRRAGQQAEQTTGLSSLTEAERRVLKLVAEYKTSKEIADELFISVRTVDRHRANIAEKLELKGAHALLQFALEYKAEL
ncbi:MAG TPA: response regulator transcription factor, partial [Blastocatellia bacterium]|nr:response regulator transcription factor [Blastocatellia bacterium]HMY74402.1 response regulator transcription factor [Blastocatellia bacterium]HMZ20200.1 response regulator transcription factor [Blastocatellia bacterium]HNG34191.1 response regulator transcription factor [Blastocatellia bacterium]